MLEKLRLIAVRFASLALPLRLALSAIVTLIAGAGIGFFAEYAAYRWALFYGIRPPFEGIPYLRVAVTALTFGVLFGGALVFLAAQAVCLYVLRNASNLIEQIGFMERLLRATFPTLRTQMLSSALPVWYRSRGFASAAGISLAVPLLVVVPVALFQAITRGVGGVEWIPVVGLFMFLFLGLLLTWRPQVRLWVSLLVLGTFVVAAPLALFSVDVYGRLLRVLGYGGALPVEVVVSDEKTTLESKSVVRGWLMLRTTQALILCQEEGSVKRFREIPLQQVVYIDSPIATSVGANLAANACRPNA